MSEREMTLQEWVERLPEIHAARREYDALRSRLTETEQERDVLQDSLAGSLGTTDKLAARLAEAEFALAILKKEREWAQPRLAEAERNEETLLGMIRHQRDVLRECLPYINESMAGRRPGRCADDIRAAVKALTADSAPAVQSRDAILWERRSVEALLHQLEEGEPDDRACAYAAALIREALPTNSASVEGEK